MSLHRQELKDEWAARSSGGLQDLAPPWVRGAQAPPWVYGAPDDADDSYDYLIAHAHSAGPGMIGWWVAWLRGWLIDGSPG